MTTYRITAVEAKSFKRIREIKFMPDAERLFVLIAGKNAQGKTSLLDALTAALGGKAAAPADPVKHGSPEAFVRVELAAREQTADTESGAAPLAITITRTFKPDGVTSLEVREDGATARGPQKLLDAIIGARFLDPLDFLHAKPAEQRATIFNITGNGKRIADLDKKRERAYDRRREVGRDLVKAQAELERLAPLVGDSAAELVDINALVAEASALEAAARADATVRAKRQAAQNTCDASRGNVARLRKEIEQLEERLAAEESHLATSEGKLAAIDAEVAALPDERARKERLGDIQAELRTAQDHNAHAAGAAAQRARLEEVKVEAERLRAEHTAAEKTIAEVDKLKGQILADAKIPVKGLDVDEDGVRLNDVPLAQASGAERLRLAVALAIVASGGLGDIWVRDGALLDDEGLAIVEEMATKSGVRCWIERVGTADTDALVIQDGVVVAEPTPKKKTRK